MWKDDPEGFIETEDEAPFARDYYVETESNLNFLAYLLVQKLFSKFTKPALASLQQYLVTIIESKSCVSNFAEKEQVGVLVEDAVYNVAGMLPHLLQNDYVDRSVMQFDIEIVLAQIEGKLGEHLLFKRRYAVLLQEWIPLIPGKS